MAQQVAVAMPHVNGKSEEIVDPSEQAVSQPPTAAARVKVRPSFGDCSSAGGHWIVGYLRLYLWPVVGHQKRNEKREMRRCQTVTVAMTTLLLQPVSRVAQASSVFSDVDIITVSLFSQQTPFH